MIARGKIAVWSKDLLFLDAAELFVGRALPDQLAAELAAKAGIDQDSHVWCAVSDTHPAEIYRDHCFICG